MDIGSVYYRRQNCLFCEMINRWRLIRKIDYEKLFFSSRSRYSSRSYRYALLVLLKITSQATFLKVLSRDLGKVIPSTLNTLRMEQNLLSRVQSVSGSTIPGRVVKNSTCSQGIHTVSVVSFLALITRCLRVYVVGKTILFVYGMASRVPPRRYL